METLRQSSQPQPKLIGNVPIAKIRESSSNPRKSFDGLEELQESVKASGVLSPILVRPRDDGYELIYGARRRRAAELAGLTEIPCMMVECSDDQALELQIVENAQRVDVHPMEEAEAYAQLAIRLEKHHPDYLGEIARRVGKTRAHVAQRLVLVKLPKQAQLAFRDRKIDHEVALLIARTPDPEMRAELCKRALQPNRIWDGNQAINVPVTAAQLRKYIQSEALLKLKGAPFDRTDAELVPAAGACGPCPKRTGNSRDLFGDVSDEDRCTDPGCFRSKLDAAFARKAKVAKEAGAEILPTAVAKKIFHSDGGRLLHGSGFKDPNESEWFGGKSTSLKKYLGKHAPDRVVVVQDLNGFPRELWHEKDVEAAIAKVQRRRPQKSDDDYRLKQREEQKKAKLRKAAKYAAMERFTAAVMLPAQSERDFLMLLLAAIHRGNWGMGEDDVFYRTKEVAAVFPEAPEDEKKFEAWVSKLSVDKLRGVVLIDLVGCIKTDYKAERAVEAMVTYSGMKWPELEKAAVLLAEQRKQEQKAAAAAATDGDRPAKKKGKGRKEKRG